MATPGEQLAEMRGVVLKHFPKAPGLPNDHKNYMKLVEEIYVTEGLKGTPVATI